MNSRHFWLTLMMIWPALQACSFQNEVPSAPLSQALKADPTAEGALRFVYDDLGGLSTHTLQTFALPYKLTTTALAMYRQVTPEPGVSKTILEQYGLYIPDKIVNWPNANAPTIERPLGLVHGQVTLAFPKIDVDAVNNGCATCHGGHLYDAQGLPTKDAWLGLPNTSFDGEAYNRDLFSALTLILETPFDQVIQSIKKIYPNVSESEIASIKNVVLPAVKRRSKNVSSFVEFDLGAPGITNGAAAAKLYLDPATVSHEKDTAFTAVPNILGVGLRSSFLYDGLYAPPGKERQREMTLADVTPEHISEMGAIPSVFSSFTLGITPERAAQNVTETKKMYRWLAEARTPPFPAEVDAEKASVGQTLYQKKCLHCHGVFEEMSEGKRPLELIKYDNVLVPGKIIKTDPLRYKAVNQRLATRFSKSAFGAFVDVQSSEGYVAPILSGVWASAPYFHNGSVPTLWHVLNPEKRPSRFWVGGHRLSYEKAGIDLVESDEGTWVYPQDYKPWSSPALIDTQKPGYSNQGHEAQFQGLSDDDKFALIEYLKLL